MAVIYGIKNCDSVKKALSFFTAHNIPYTFVDFNTTPVNQDKLSQWIKKSDFKTLFNAKSATYRSLGLSSMELSDQDKLSWMEKENRLIKRPVIEYGSHVIIGFNISQYEGTFLS